MPSGSKLGAPTKYKREYNDQVYKLCLIGYTDKEIADFYDVCEATINNWKREYPDFLESIKKGKTIADGEVAASLYHRATGYSHKEDKVFNNNGEAMIVTTDKHYPPDTAAAFIWLKNRQSAKWRERPEADLSDNNEIGMIKVEIVGANNTHDGDTAAS